MNKRIRELAEQAGQLQLATPDNPSADAIMVLIGPNIEKFAELIVGECARAIINDSRLNDVRSAANGCVRTINQHFGVEE